jgi:Pyruvate/2-oxoglutarate dehydrogenase complex, dihydrolipoamide acyltransferase (E2) component, and related enzymes
MDETGQLTSRRLSISCNRALVLDGLHFARELTLFPVEREFDLAEIARLRQRQPARISWVVLFLKAYATVARQHAPLRQAYIRWPWPHLLESPYSVAMLAINRQFEGEDRLCWGRFDEPADQPLTAIQERLDRYTRDPVEQIFKRQVRLSRLPGWLRRSLLWWNLNFAGAMRAKRLGTFSLSTLAGQGALNRAHPTFLTSSMTYGPIDDDGRCLVTLLCDHRVVDGAIGARALNDFHNVMRGQISAELRASVTAQAA